VSWYLTKQTIILTKFNRCNICTLLSSGYWRHFWQVQTNRSLFTAHVHLVLRFRTHYAVSALCGAYGNLTVFSALDEARERGDEYQRVNGMINLKKAT